MSIPNFRAYAVTTEKEVVNLMPSATSTESGRRTGQSRAVPVGRISPAQNASPLSERQDARDDGPKKEPGPAPGIRLSRPPDKPIAPEPFEPALGQALIRRTLAKSGVHMAQPLASPGPGDTRDQPTAAADRRWLVLAVVAV